jgi:PAS domain S-box-containing protein
MQVFFSFLRVLSFTSVLFFSCAHATQHSYFYDIFKTHPSIMLIIEPNSGNIIEANDAAIEFYGYSQQQMQALSISDINTFTPAQIQQELQAAKKQQRSFFIFRHQLANGEIKTVEVRSAPIEFHTQPVLLSVIHDISSQRLQKNDILHYQGSLEEIIDEQMQALKDAHKKTLFIFLFFIVILSGVVLVLFKMFKNQKYLKENLSIKNQEIQAILNNNAVAIFVANRKRDILKTNQRACELFGYSQKELQGSSFELLHTSKDSFEAFAPYYNKLKQSNIAHIEYPFRKKDGSLIYCSVYGTLLDENNPQKGVIWTLVDTSEKKEIEANLKKTKERLVNIIQGTNTGTWEWNIQTNKVIINKRWTQMLGYDINTLKPIDLKLYKKISHPEDFKRSQALIKQHFEEKLPYYECEIRMKHHLGHYIWILHRGCVNTYDKKGRPLLMAGTAQDITRIKEYEQNLEKEVKQKTRSLNELNKHLEKKVQDELGKNRKKDILLQQQSRLAALGEMLGNIAHQWRQPLSAITSSISGLKVKQEFGQLQSNDIEEVSQAIMHNANFLSETINDFRNFLKKDKKKSTFLVANAIFSTLKIVQASLKNNYIEVDTSNIDTTVEYFGNENLLKQVMLNLISNAKDALLEQKIENKKITLELVQKRNDILIYVIDNANGIDHAIKEKIFDPYFTTKHPSQGTGLGLYMSNQIIKEYFNGSIELFNRSNTKDSGACFIVRFKKITHV